MGPCGRVSADAAIRGEWIEWQGVLCWRCCSLKRVCVCVSASACLRACLRRLPAHAGAAAAAAEQSPATRVSRRGLLSSFSSVQICSNSFSFAFRRLSFSFCVSFSRVLLSTLWRAELDTLLVRSRLPSSLLLATLGRLEPVCEASSAPSDSCPCVSSSPPAAAADFSSSASKRTDVSLDCVDPRPRVLLRGVAFALDGVSAASRLSMLSSGSSSSVSRATPRRPERRGVGVGRTFFGAAAAATPAPAGVAATAGGSFACGAA